MPQIIHGKCPDLPHAAGCFITAGEADFTGVLWPRGAVFTAGDRFTTEHELGHAYDATMMDAGERQRFIHLTGAFAQTEPWVSAYVDKQGTLVDTGTAPVEVFADMYAACRIGLINMEGHEWTTSSGYLPPPHTERMICGMIARAGQDTGTLIDANGYR